MVNNHDAVAAALSVANKALEIASILAQEPERETPTDA